MWIFFPTVSYLTQKKSESESCLVVSYSFQPHGLYMGPFPSPGDLPNPGIFPAQRSSQPRSPTLQTDSLPAEPPEKPKNTGMGSLSLLQQIFSTQEMNQGLLHYRQILYQLSYQGRPPYTENVLYFWFPET